MICFLAILRRESICLRVHVVSSTMAFEESKSRTLVCKLVVLRCQSSCHAHTVTCAHTIHATCAIRPIGLTIHSSDQWVGSTLHHGCCFCCWRWWSTARRWRCRLDRGQPDMVISSNASRTKSADYIIYDSLLLFIHSLAVTRKNYLLNIGTHLHCDMMIISYLEMPRLSPWEAPSAALQLLRLESC